MDNEQVVTIVTYCAIHHQTLSEGFYLRSIIKHAVVSSLIAVFAATTSADSLYDLPVQINKMMSQDGHILLAVYAVGKDASWEDQPIQSHAIAASKAVQGQLQYTLQGLPAGHYAIRLFHDENDNQRLDMADNGFPLESFAFSAVESTVAIPRLEQAVFYVPLNGSQVSLRLKHPQRKNKPVLSP